MAPVTVGVGEFHTAFSPDCASDSPPISTVDRSTTSVTVTVTGADAEFSSSSVARTVTS